MLYISFCNDLEHNLTCLGSSGHTQALAPAIGAEALLLPLLPVLPAFAEVHVVRPEEAGMPDTLENPTLVFGFFNFGRLSKVVFADHRTCDPRNCGAWGDGGGGGGSFCLKANTTPEGFGASV